MSVWFHSVSNQRHSCSYRLHITERQPDFELRVIPSGINIAPGGSGLITVHALRKDGFEGEIELSPKDFPQGFSMSPAVIPEGGDKICLTITAPAEAAKGAVSPQIKGSASINNKIIDKLSQHFEDMDKDSDRKLSLEESGLDEETFTRIDSDEDGLLTIDELATEVSKRDITKDLDDSLVESVFAKEDSVSDMLSKASELLAGNKYIGILIIRKIRSFHQWYKSIVCPRKKNLISIFFKQFCQFF